MDFKSSIIEQNNLIKKNKEKDNKIKCIYKQNKDFSFSNEEENLNPNLIGPKKNDKSSLIESSNNCIINKLEKKISLKIINRINSNILGNNKNNTSKTLNVNRLEEENKILKEEIELDKPNTVKSKKIESIDSNNTIQDINKIKKEKKISYNNSINLINDYKKRENFYKIKIKEMENEFNKKEEDLIDKVAILKNELFIKNRVIKELNQKIFDLNKQMIKLKKIISEKLKIIQILSNNKYDTLREMKNIEEIPYLSSCKSCNQINFKRIDITKEGNVKKRQKSLHNINNLKYYSLNKNTLNGKMKTNNSLKYHHKMKINDFMINNGDYHNNSNINNDNYSIIYLKKNSSYKKNYTKKTNQNTLKFELLKRDNSYNNISHISESSIINKNKFKKIDPNISKNNINSLNLIKSKIKIDKKSIKQFKINIDKNTINKITMISKIPRRIGNNYNNKEEKNNYFLLSDDSKSVKIKRKIKNLKSEYKNNRRIEINNYYLNNPSLISNSSFRNISPLSNK
jgi:hypothetical protein